MGANRLSTGKTVNYTPVADVDAGDMVKFGTMVGVAEADIAAGELGALAVCGIFRITSDALSAGPDLGDVLDVNLTDMEVVDAGSGDSAINVIAADTYSSVPDECDVWINYVGG